MSGGEKARLLLACITRDAPHLLLLDEPTNHLDVDAREALVHALNDYQGAVVLVSHDTHLVSLVADRLWLVADGTCVAYDGDLDDYRRQVVEGGREARRQAKRKPSDKPAVSRQEERRQRAQAREALTNLRKQAKAAETKLERLQKEKATLHARLADPKFYDGPADDVTALNQKAGKIDRDIGKAETEWLEAQAALEAAENSDAG